MEKTIVILDNNGLALGAVRISEENVILFDDLGKQIQQVSIKMTFKDVKEILLKKKDKLHNMTSNL